jgi:hypothetical protein
LVSGDLEGEFCGVNAIKLELGRAGDVEVG